MLSLVIYLFNILSSKNDRFLMTFISVYAFQLNSCIEPQTLHQPRS